MASPTQSGLIIERMPLPVLKGDVYQMFLNGPVSAPGSIASDIEIDMEGFNALASRVIVSGANVSANIGVRQSAYRGGVYLPVPDPAGSWSVMNSVSGDYRCEVTLKFARIYVSQITGIVNPGDGIQVICQPFVSGQSSIPLYQRPNSGQFTLTGTVTDGPSLFARRVVLQNISTDATVLWGTSASSMPLQLAPGQVETVEVAGNLNTLAFTIPAGVSSATVAYYTLD